MCIQTEQKIVDHLLGLPCPAAAIGNWNPFYFFFCALPRTQFGRGAALCPVTLAAGASFETLRSSQS